jgi:thiamine-monophosphate kinase
VPGELGLIDALQEALDGGGSRVITGRGDDAAVVRARPYAVTSVDTMVEGVHFRSAQLTASEIGHRALAAALSDLAAMGAEPGEAYLALGLPPGFGAERALELIAEAGTLASRCGVTVAGGDITRAGELIVSWTVVGWADSPQQLIGRGGARPGDLVGVTGELGGAGAGLALLDVESAGADVLARSPGGDLGGLGSAIDPGVRAALHARYARPEPRLAAGRALAAAGARAMLDLSDGLATDAGHLARSSGVELELELAALPLPPGLDAVCAALELDPRALAASAGDDYELCVCVPPSARKLAEAAARSCELRFSWIGRVRAGNPCVRFADAGGSSLRGYEHSV